MCKNVKTKEEVTLVIKIVIENIVVGIETMELKDIISILIGTISLAVAIVTAYNTKKISDIQRKKEITKIDNSENRLAVSLNTYMTIYNRQKDIVMKIFSFENREKFLYKIMDVNDLEMIAYIEEIVHMSQESISTYINTTEHELNCEEIKRLQDFSSKLKNFFYISNEVKDKARQEQKRVLDNKISFKKKKNYLTVSDYSNQIIAGLPYNMRIMDNNSIDLLKCISIFDKNIQEDWHEIERFINK